MSNIIQVLPQPGVTVHTAPVWQYDAGQILRINGIALPASYKAEFSNTSRGDAISTVQTTAEILIPAHFLTSGSPVYIWLVVVDEQSRTTEYALQVPVAPRAKPIYTEPQPEERTAMDQALAALNAGVAEVRDAAKDLDTLARVTSLDGTALAKGNAIEAVGIPVYVDNVGNYAAYGITATGWYVFARVAAPAGEAVTAGTTITGAAGYIATMGGDHVDLAVRFDTTAQSVPVEIAWGGKTDRYVFRAGDLAVRNLDYRVTFYIYDITPYATWSYALTTDAAFAENKAYYTKDENDVYTLAQVETKAYALTADATFAEGKTYYTKDGDTYTAATVTVGDAVTPETYYEQSSVPVPAYYKDGYVLTADTAFQAGTTYYTKDGDTYTEAAVTPEEAVAADTYYVPGKVRATGVFESGTTYYTKDADVYTEAAVTAGDAIPAYYNHSKLRFEGMVANVTYMLPATVDCPIEIVLPQIADDGHGAWFEIQMRYDGSRSCTLLPPEGVKIGTATTQAQTAGINTIDLQYTVAGDVKMWTLLNTHSNIPTT